jgi:hypothetical protein
MKIQFGFDDSDQSVETNIKEHVIWKNEIVIGAVRQEVIETQIITNLRVLQNNSYYFLRTLDDMMVMNQHGESQHRRHKIHSQKSVISHRNDTKTTVGDVVFVYRGKPVVAFKQIVDPISLLKLAKNARLNLISLLKTVKGNNSSRVTKKHMEIFGVSNSYPVKRTHNRSLVSSELKCTKCGELIIKDSNFCISCGYKVSFLCLECNHENPSGSSFCNNCGFALT